MLIVVQLYNVQQLLLLYNESSWQSINQSLVIVVPGLHRAGPAWQHDSKQNTAKTCDEPQEQASSGGGDGYLKTGSWFAADGPCAMISYSR